MLYNAFKSGCLNILLNLSALALAIASILLEGIFLSSVLLGEKKLPVVNYFMYSGTKFVFSSSAITLRFFLGVLGSLCPDWDKNELLKDN